MIQQMQTIFNDIEKFNIFFLFSRFTHQTIVSETCERTEQILHACLSTSYGYVFKAYYFKHFKRCKMLHFSMIPNEKCEAAA